MIKDNTNDLEQSLLLEHPELKLIADPFVRFYTYRSKTEKEFSDRDRSNTAKNIYKKLNWYDESIDKDFLEPDTFFASSHNLIRNLFNKYDLVYYRDNFKSYCIANMIDYDKLTHYKGSVNLFSVFKKQTHPLCLGNSYNIAAVSKAP